MNVRNYTGIPKITNLQLYENNIGYNKLLCNRKYTIFITDEKLC